MPERQLTASRRAFALAILFFAALTGRGAEGPYEALLAAARSLEQAGRLAEARQTDEVAIQLDPERHEAFLHAGQVALALGYPQPAKNYLRQAREVAPAGARPAIEAVLAQVDPGTAQSMMTDGDERDFNALLERVRSFRVESTALADNPEFLTLYLRAKKLWLRYGQPSSLSYEPKTHLLMAEFTVRLGHEGTGRKLVPMLQTARAEFPADSRPAVDRALALLATKGWTEAAAPKPEILSLPKGLRPASAWVPKKFFALAKSGALARLEMRWVRPGAFRMLPANDDEKREGHAARITRGFWLGATEVTQAQWRAVMGPTNNPSSFRGVDFPVENVTWEEAMEFCRKLTALAAGRPEFPTG
ncbi:MAG: SUMF1/EgtB/PvdO family nonheme iron enzyme [Verrucomicrobia bacterium]|nr:SUMF1/EgtB/PvdO family nonheme iron enzyme [Verrucomicrobiota bacterium]